MEIWGYDGHNYQPNYKVRERASGVSFFDLARDVMVIFDGD
jgi:hypothetical protein